MFRVHTAIIRSIRCWVAAYGFLHCKEWGIISHTYTPMLYSTYHIDKCLYTTECGHYTHASCCLILYSE